jgi:hypothetical protein
MNSIICWYKIYINKSVSVYINQSRSSWKYVFIATVRADLRRVSSLDKRAYLLLILVLLFRIVETIMELVWFVWRENLE